MLSGSCACGRVRVLITGKRDTVPGAIHFMIGAKVPWRDICDDLPPGDSGPPAGARD
jgi:hypothetical protein